MGEQPNPSFLSVFVFVSDVPPHDSACQKRPSYTSKHSTYDLPLGARCVPTKVDGAPRGGCALPPTPLLRFPLTLPAAGRELIKTQGRPCPCPPHPARAAASLAGCNGPAPPQPRAHCGQFTREAGSHARPTTRQPNLPQQTTTTRCHRLAARWSAPPASPPPPISGHHPQHPPLAPASGAGRGLRRPDWPAPTYRSSGRGSRAGAGRTSDARRAAGQRRQAGQGQTTQHDGVGEQPEVRPLRAATPAGPRAAIPGDGPPAPPVRRAGGQRAVAAT